MKIIACATLKGGVGKSLTAFNLCGFLAEKGYRVLAIDMDPQGNLTNNLGVDRTVDGFKSIKDILEKQCGVDEVILESVIKELPGIDLIGSSIFLTRTEFQITSLAGRENILRNYLEDNKEKFNQYDYIIIDTNPSMSIINQNALVVADSIILLSDVSMNAFEGAQLFMALWEDICKNLRIKNNVKAMLVNNFDKRIKLAKDYIGFCMEDEEIGPMLLNTIIPVNVKLKESELEAKPINIFDKTSKGYEAFSKLVEELYERGIF